MDYKAALNYIESMLRFGSKPGLERITRLLGKMGNPQDGLKFVHVAGTNGKGSICSAAACVLQNAGYKTGLTISPYITDFCERIQINGQMIPHEELAREVESIKPLVQSVADEYEQPTEFEIVTAIAFDYFKKSGCDIVVAEVGLGGRFDATNVIRPPLVSVIASLSLDHTAILGNTLSEIAFEKAGIIKENPAGGVTVSSPGQNPEALAVLMKACAEKGNTLVMPNLSGVNILREGLDGSDIEYKGLALHIPLCGRHQVANFVTAAEALSVLRGRGFTISDAAVRDGFAAVRFPARIEILHRSPLILLDGAHNPSGIATLSDSIRRFLKGRRICVIMGMLKDKNYHDSIRSIASLAENFAAVRPDSLRALDAADCADMARPFCKNVSYFDDYGRALADSLQRAGEDGTVVICGSLYLAGPMRRRVLDRYSNL